jgi:hypothetical protein
VSKETVLSNPAIDCLATVVEEGARASRESVRRFIEPAHGTLRRATAKRHHLVFGRRGSGKSSLLLKAADSLESQGQPIAFVDLEPFKGHHYPDVLISVLIATFKKFQQWLSKHPPSDIQRKWYHSIPFWPRPQAQARRGELVSQVQECINDLESQLFLTDDAMLVATSSDSSTEENTGRAKVSASVRGTVANASVEEELASRISQHRAGEVREETKRSKQDFLHRSILAYQSVFRTFSELTGSASFLFLDDLYHLRRSDQPHVLDYFHRVAKNNGLWLKIGTIKNRTSWYIHGPQPIGLKIGDDADSINLDLTLEKFSSSREFLVKILSSYCSEAKAPPVRDFLADGGIDRLVIASGGVTRDFLGIFRRSIDQARERVSANPSHTRGPKIGAEDVNVASGDYGDTKKEEFQRDTLEDRTQLEAVFDRIRLFCLSRNKANVFLVDQEAQDEEHQLIQELIDLRLVHHVKSRVTVGSKPGKVYRAHLLDVSQYTGERRRKGIEMVEFWRTDNKDVLRRPQYIFNPTVSREAIEREIEKAKKGEAPEDPRQGKLFE